MNIYVVASDYYSHIMGAYAKLLNKHWPGQNVTVLCYDVSLLPQLPGNFETVSLGCQSDHKRYVWTDGLIPFFESIDDEYFMLTVEDLLLMSPIDQVMLRRLEELVASLKVQKAMLNLLYDGEPYEDGIAKLTPIDPEGEGRYLNVYAGLHPAIWNRDFFMKFLNPGLTPWGFERQVVSDDGDVVVRPSEAHVFNCMNVFGRGKTVMRYPSATPYDGYQRVADDKVPAPLGEDVMLISKALADREE